MNTPHLARGVLIGLALAAPLWLVLIVAVSWLLGR